ncbi:MAG: hypothetical protein U0168_27630 [Nannocystaceae bacterium]
MLVTSEHPLGVIEVLERLVGLIARERDAGEVDVAQAGVAVFGTEAPLDAFERREHRGLGAIDLAASERERAEVGAHERSAELGRPAERIEQRQRAVEGPLRAVEVPIVEEHAAEDVPCPRRLGRLVAVAHDGHRQRELGVDLRPLGRPHRGQGPGADHPQVDHPRVRPTLDPGDDRLGAGERRQRVVPAPAV